MNIIRLSSQLGPVLRAARVGKGLTQPDIAKSLGITVQAVSKLENNAGRASFDRILRLCLLLGLEVTLRPRNTTPSSKRQSKTPEW